MSAPGDPASVATELATRCDLDVVANEPREVRVTCGISTSLAFGGNDSALVMRALGA